MTESAFEAELLRKLGYDPDGKSKIINAANFLHANEPSLFINTASEVLRIRNSDPNMFDRFHQSIIDISQEVLSKQDFEQGAQKLFRKEIIPQIEEIEKLGSSLITSASSGLVTSMATIGLATLTGSALPLSAILGFGVALAAGMTLPSVPEYLKVRKRPAFIWKQIVRKNK